MSQLDARAGSDWLPVRFSHEAQGCRIDWCRLGDRRLSEPFYEDTVQRCQRAAAGPGSRRQTGLDELEQMAAGGLEPSGLIFHLSRCGSTALAQMLAGAGRHIVASEAPPLDQVLRAGRPGAEIADEERAHWLRLMARAIGVPRHGETRFFLKLDSWHILDWRLFEKAFPGVPWVFLYRDPVEIIVSHLRRRGSQMVPVPNGTALFGWPVEECLSVSFEEYCARVLSRICHSALVALRHNSRAAPLNYDEIPERALVKLESHFRLVLSGGERDLMLEASRRDAKSPGRIFASDREAKRLEITPALLLVSEGVRPLYEELEELRGRITP